MATPVAALLAAVLAGLLALAAQTSPWAVVAVAIGGQLLLATGIASRELSPSQGVLAVSGGDNTVVGRGRSTVTWLVVAAAGTVASVATVTADVVDLGTLAPVAAGGVLACFVLELVRRGGREGLAGSLATSVTGVALAVLTASWPVTMLLRFGEPLVTVGAVGVGVCALVWAVPGPRGILGPLGVVVAAVGGWVLLPMLSGPYAAAAGAALAGAGAAVAAVALAAASWWAEGAREHLALVATLPLALAAPVVHLVAQLAGAVT